MSPLEEESVWDDSISQSVVEAVAEAEGVPPEQLNPPLYKAIDPDALERLFAATPTADRVDGKITFDYLGYEVSVSANGDVTLQPRDRS